MWKDHKIEKSMIEIMAGEWFLMENPGTLCREKGG
jgi:hypothetical protein